MISTPLEDVFRSVRVAATNAGTGFERLRLDARRGFPLLSVPNKRMRFTKQVATSDAEAGWDRIRLDISRGFPLLSISNKPTTRKDQAELFAVEEAELHQQLLIEQQIEQERFERQILQQLQEEQQPEAQTTPTEQRQDSAPQAEPAPSVEQREATPETHDQPSNKTAGPIRLIPVPKTADKVVAIERKLSLIRQRLAAPPTKNEAGIATLRAAVAC